MRKVPAFWGLLAAVPLVLCAADWSPPEERLPLAGKWSLAAEWVVPAPGPGAEPVADRPSSPPHESSDGWIESSLPNHWDDAFFVRPSGSIWLLREIEVPAAWENQPLTVHLGAIDDADECYWNGQLVGATGKEIPEHWQVERVYEVPAALVKAGKAVIAIRHTNFQDDAGFAGPASKMWAAPSSATGGNGISLAGEWWAQLDPAKEAEPPPADQSHAEWIAFHLPGSWKGDQRANIDRRFDMAGALWFRRAMRIPPSMADADLLLSIGRVRDSAKAYFNGTELQSMAARSDGASTFLIPAKLIKERSNELTVRIFCGSGRGGFEGPASAMFIARANAGFPEGPGWTNKPDILPTIPTPSFSGEVTSADLPGPDGIMYPDFRRVGIPGGIPDVPVVAQAGEFGAIPGDDKDDSAGLQAAINFAGTKGGGAVLLQEGDYVLDRPVVVRESGVVIRGAGIGKTRLEFRYGIAPGTVKIYLPGNVRESIGPHETIQLHADPEGMTKMRLFLNDQLVAERGKDEHGGGTFNLSSPPLFRLLSENKIQPGEIRVRGVAEWANGSSASDELVLRLDPALARPEKKWNIPSENLGAVSFYGDEWSGRGTTRRPLVATLPRGGTRLTAASLPPIEVGGFAYVNLPDSPAFSRQLRTKRTYFPRRHLARVTAIDGRNLEVDQPARIAFTVSGGATVEPWNPMLRSGIEHLSIRQSTRLWTHGIYMSHVAECWVRGVEVIKAGRNSVEITFAKNCEIRDGRFDDGWYQGGGGTSYLGWSESFDCLMENVDATRLRHAPNFQQGASGNVIRNSRFLGSDAQWHQGFAYENLLENVTVDAAFGSGSYGDGVFVQHCGDWGVHGPGGGPRNVIFHCDITSPRRGIVLKGSNEAWIIQSSRVTAGHGVALEFENQSFHHTVIDNVLVLKQPGLPAVFVADRDCAGISFIRNQAFGTDRFLAGDARDVRLTDNRTHPLADPLPALPSPPFPSLVHWQRSKFPLSTPPHN